MFGKIFRNLMFGKILIQNAFSQQPVILKHLAKSRL